MRVLPSNVVCLLGCQPVAFSHCARTRCHTTERGEQTPPCQLNLGSFQHLLVVFGGPHGLEYALQHDELASQHSCPSELFDRQGRLFACGWWMGSMSAT